MAAEILNCLFCHNSAATCVRNKQSTHLESLNAYLNGTSLGFSIFGSRKKSKVITGSWLLKSWMLYFAITLQLRASETTGVRI